MDGSAATSFAERTRSQISRAFANRACNEATAQSELFEQLLNMKFTVQPPPEKQPTTPDAPVSKSSSASRDEKADAKVDDEKDDEPAVTVATLTQVVPLVADKPVELTSNQPETKVVSDDGPSDVIHLNDNQVDQQPATTAVDSQAIKTASSDLDDQVVVADTSITDVQTDTTPDASTPTTGKPQTDVRKTGDDISSKNDPHAATKLEGATGALGHVEQTKPTETKETSTTTSQHEIAIEPKANAVQKEDCDDRRGDHREKWFERKDDVISESSFERPNDTSGVVAAQDNSDPTPKDASQPLTLPAQSTPLPQLETTIASPVAPPATLSIVPQASPVAAVNATPTTSVNSESTSAVTSAPTRTVGHQAAKANAKETISEPGLSQQERVRVIQRIARSFNRISAEGGSINLRLHPEHLGSVSVQVKLEGRSLSARLSTETTAARDAIMQDLPALRQRLADQGFDVTKFQVDVAGNGADASFAQSNGQPQFGQSDNRSSGAQTDYRRVAAMRESRAATARQLAPISSQNLLSSAGLDLQA